MKKIIQFLLIIILIFILSLIVIFVFNPLDLRTKIIGNILNSYLSNNIESYEPATDSLNNSIATTSTSTDKNPLLNEEQEKKLESFGINVEQLPSSITPGMKECFVEKLGEKRAEEIAKGDSPTAIDFFKARECIGK